MNYKIYLFRNKNKLPKLFNRVLSMTIQKYKILINNSMKNSKKNYKFMKNIKTVHAAKDQYSNAKMNLANIQVNAIATQKIKWMNLKINRKN